ncbi:MAG: hypothetical protein U0892_10370 [Pirellulales bacterium]
MSVADGLLGMIATSGISIRPRIIATDIAGRALSAGLIGYFPVLLAWKSLRGQLIDAARTDLGDLDAAFSRGESPNHLLVDGECMFTGVPALNVGGASGRQALSVAPLLNYLQKNSKSWLRHIQYPTCCWRPPSVVGIADTHREKLMKPSTPVLRSLTRSNY